MPIPHPGRPPRELELQSILDRTVAKTLQLALDPFWRSELPNLGRSVWQLFADLQHAIRERQAFVLAVDDIQNCFPTTPIASVVHWHQELISQPELLWLTERIIQGHGGPERMTGLCQGSPYSPVALELLLHHCLDVPMTEAHSGLPLLLRYVDNLTFLCRSEREGQEAQQWTRNCLSSYGYELKGEDDAPRDLRDPDFNQVVLGMIPFWQHNQLKFRIPDESYADLETGLLNANLCPRPVTTARRVCQGWLEAVGMALTNAVTPTVIDRILEIGRQAGYREIDQRSLRETAKRSRRRWIALCESRNRT